MTSSLRKFLKFLTGRLNFPTLKIRQNARKRQKGEWFNAGKFKTNRSDEIKNDFLIILKRRIMLEQKIA